MFSLSVTCSTMFIAKRFSPWKAARHNNHLRLVQSVGHFIKINEAGGQAGQTAAAFVKILNARDCLTDQFLHREVASPARLVNLNLTLHLIEQARYFPSCSYASRTISVQVRTVFRSRYFSQTILK